MIFEGEFYFHGIRRWNLGWPTPNYAGAFVATLLPWCWAWKQRWTNIWNWTTAILFIAIESWLWFALCKTYSRGGLIAALAALAGWFVLEWWTRRDTRREVASGLAVRLAVLMTLLIVTGFIGRVSPAYVQTDGAVANRLDLWRGGLAMIAAAPWTGWGPGESGRAYMNWFQGVERTESYTTMVNSYLHLGVEYGLPVLCLAIFSLTLLLALAIAAPFRDDRLSAIAGMGVAAWAVANVFTTLWTEPKLWIIPGLAAGILGLRSARSPATRWRFALTCAGVASTLTLASVTSGGNWLLHKQTMVISATSDHTVVLTPAETAASTWEVWPDPYILGSMPGKELRRWFKGCSPAVRAVVHNPSRPDETKSGPSGSADVVMLFGRQVARAGEPDASSRREQWLIHPSVPPPQSSTSIPSAVTVILPAIDETGLNEAWKTWSALTGARLVMSPGSGLDIRSAWPEVILRARTR